MDVEPSNKEVKIDNDVSVFGDNERSGNIYYIKLNG